MQQPDLTGPRPAPQRILFAGIGNPLRRDDGAGVALCHQLQPAAWREVLLVEMSIENYIGKINRMNPDLLVLVDCVNFGREPGYWDYLPVEQLTEHTFHTHHISLKTIAELFRMPVWVLGIQPLSLEFGEGLSPAVRKTTDELAMRINASTGMGSLESKLTASAIENS